ncbi:unnamed protein product [Urochloa humidicola]
MLTPRLPSIQTAAAPPAPVHLLTSHRFKQPLQLHHRSISSSPRLVAAYCFQIELQERGVGVLVHTGRWRSSPPARKAGDGLLLPRFNNVAYILSSTMKQA